MADTATLERPRSRSKAPPAPLHCVVERKALAAALSDIQALVERRNTIPILSNVLIEAHEGALTLTGTNLDMEVRETVAAQVVTSAAVTVAADIFGSIVRELPDGCQVELQMDAGSLIVTSGRSRFTLHTLPKDDFPIIAPGELPTRFAMPAATLRAVFRRVAHAMSAEDTRAYLCGVYMEANEAEGLCFTATDGKILATVNMTVPPGAAGMPGVIIPRKAVALIARLIDGLDDEIVIEASASKLRIAVGDAENSPLVLTSKAVDGTFLNWRRAMPANSEALLKVDAGALSRAVKRVALIADQRSRGIALTLATGKVTVGHSNPLHGAATEELPADWDGRELTIGFNSSYLLATLAAMSAETAHVAMSGPRDVALLTNPDDSASRWVVMPMNA